MIYTQEKILLGFNVIDFPNVTSKKEYPPKS